MLALSPIGPFDVAVAFAFLSILVGTVLWMFGEDAWGIRLLLTGLALVGISVLVAFPPSTPVATACAAGLLAVQLGGILWLFGKNQWAMRLVLAGCGVISVAAIYYSVRFLW